MILGIISLIAAVKSTNRLLTAWTGMDSISALINKKWYETTTQTPTVKIQKHKIINYNTAGNGIVKNNILSKLNNITFGDHFT